MRSVTSKALVAACVLVLFRPAFAKDDAPMMPPYILRAHTVAVLIDTEAGLSMRDPNGNQTARKDVETALLNWGRFQPVMDAREADLVIVIRKATKAPTDVTIKDPRQNRRGGVIEPTDDGISVGVQHGPSGPVGQTGKTKVPAPSGPGQTRPAVETATAGDVFQVFEGKSDNLMDNVPGWQYVKKDGLHAHDVPAVAAFRKAIDEAEKAQQQGHP